MNKIRMTCLAINLVLGLLVSGPVAAAEQFVVLASTADDYSPGRIVATGASIALAAEQRIKLLAADGRIIALSGPWQGKLAPAPGATDPGLLAALAGVVAAAHSSDLALATFRNDGAPADPDRAEVWGVHLEQPGDYCLRNDLPVTLYWPRAFRGARVEMTDDNGGASVGIDWNRRVADWPWPESIDIVDGGRYTARLDISPKTRSFTLHRIPARLDDDAQRLTWLAQRGCGRQARALLADLARRAPTIELPGPGVQ